MPEIQALPLPQKALNLIGISPGQIRPHYSELYLGYVNKINSIRKMLRAGIDEPMFFRGLEVEETYSLNGVKLHELYFYNLSPTGGSPHSALTRALTEEFGSYDQWANDLMQTGMAARGWAVLAYDPRDQSLHNFLLDAHDHGVISGWFPLLVLDVYEHAYYIDFATNKRGYIEAFMNNIDWEVVNARYFQIPAISYLPKQEKLRKG